MIATAAEALFEYLGAETGTRDPKIEDGLRTTLRAYLGWMSRRNDIAHGYVNEREHPDYGTIGSPIAKSYSLYPSDGSSAKWCIVTGEQAYNYRTDDIDNFAKAFATLETQINEFAVRVDKWRKEMIAKLPQNSP